MIAAALPTGEVHPVADLFPMLPEDELHELAADIRANGLQHPLVIDKDGVLIDGRNRWAACQIAGVDPRFEELADGVDPVAYILSTNVQRRHMNAGQRAMVTVRAIADFKLKSQKQLGETLRLNEGRISQAGTILKYRPDLADEVIAGTLPLNDAYAQAKARKDGKDTAEARMAVLEREAPSLALEVREERLTVNEAWAAYQQRKADEERERKETTQIYVKAITSLWSVLPEGSDLVVANWEPSANNMAAVAPLQHLWTADGIRTVAARLEALASAVDGLGGKLP